ncbi:MAG: hypothetical protein COW01_15170 [Bdellovibrionales bacterium CG12_big_fil_rev_8_21_14_0_65_38_15]|nr:MAG: hypothetical protein COW79_04645 [Bdellovibrionales bacterium CG22_combo_CG10-13_8_21_14_all_38_13]PIQ52703.1 MAG: hypothetical protein COW01_15170 [Bdellovibrionales bacterium CG12_big_fil_rev_8_21_14_0_65_38_15]PIR31069.1 MAG: hypothetical protein COV38_02265 [Bdellovibrionales bacterium CG11_big_fil_rev_8_21_14_0_20_38_13]
MALVTADNKPIINKSKIEVKKSKVETPVPVVDGIHLHSIYNPAKEAETFIGKYNENLSKQNSVLVLGLGFGYHVWQLESELRKHHQTWNIYVIEPNTQMTEEFKKFRPVEFSSNTRVISGENVSDYYDDINLVKFMASKPLVIPHAASFNLSEGFFKNFMSYQASTKLEDVSRKLEDTNLGKYLLSLGEPDEDITNVLRQLNLKKYLNANDHFLSFFNSVTSGEMK